MSKYPNPVRGYVSCPICQSAATAHQVGEGKLIATGEAPKNSRNIGTYYYKCPQCGNSSISNKVHEYIEAHKVDTESALLIQTESSTPPLSLDAVLLDKSITDTLIPALTELTDNVTVTPNEPLTSTGAVSGGNESVKNSDELEEENTRTFSWKPVLMGLGVLLLFGWVCNRIVKRHQSKLLEREEVTNGAVA